jgi:hypothetical protein
MLRKLSVFILLLAVPAAVSGCVTYPVAYPTVRVPPPPAVVINEPAFLYLIPTWGIYFVPDISVNIMSYNGLWYYNVRGAWYWSRSYLGPWDYIHVDRVPGTLRKLPRDYRSKYRRDYYKVPFAHWRKRHTEPPPRYSQKEPPYLYKTPRSGVYAYPGAKGEIYYHKDRWYSRFKGVWYWSWSYNGPWAYKDVDRLPGKMKDMPRQKYDKDDDRYKRVPWKKWKGKGGKGKGEWDDDY